MYCSSQSDHLHITFATHVKCFTDTNFCSDVFPFICSFIPRVISMQPKWVSKSQKRKNEYSFRKLLAIMHVAEANLWDCNVNLVSVCVFVSACLSPLWQGHCYTLDEVSLCGGRLRICMKFSVSVMHLS